LCIERDFPPELSSLNIALARRPPKLTHKPTLKSGLALLVADLTVDRIAALH
jgi:hypothetical protein